MSITDLVYIECEINTYFDVVNIAYFFKLE